MNSKFHLSVVYCKSFYFFRSLKDGPANSLLGSGRPPSLRILTSSSLPVHDTKIQILGETRHRGIETDTISWKFHGLFSAEEIAGRIRQGPVRQNQRIALRRILHFRQANIFGARS